MPRLDGTGPLGQGPLTGRGMGNCAGAGVGTGGFFRRGFRRFWGRPRYGLGQNGLLKEERRETLLAEKEEIERELKELGD